VEIESHLAACPSCQAERDSIAALRDRTTALLARLAPPRGFPPAFDSLRRRAALEVSARRRRWHAGAWAASLVAALGLGWTANNLMMTPLTETPTRVASPSVVPAVRTPAVTPAILRPQSKSTVPARQAAQQRPITRRPIVSPIESLPPVVPAPSLELTSVDMSRTDRDLELDGMWRTMSWDGAQAEAGDKLPHIDGLPVVQVQLQAAEEGKQPLMVVAQQLASGEVIRTIEGPMNDVSHLLARRTMTDPDSVPTQSDSSRPLRGPDRTDRTMAMQRGDRMLVITGALPSDSLLAMIRRLNAEMRSK